MTVAGLAVCVAGAVLGAVLCALYAPAYVRTVRLPVSPILAIGVNLLLIRFTHRVTRSRRLALLPGLAWMGLMILAAGRTSEGDLLLASNNWVGLATIAAGVLTYTIAAFRLSGLGAPRPHGGLANPPPER